MEGSTGRDASQQTFRTDQCSACSIRIFFGNCENLINYRTIQNAGDKIGTDSLQSMGTGMPLGEKGRGGRLYGNNLDLRVLLFQKSPNTGNGSTGANTCNKNVKASLRILPDFRTGGAIMRHGIGSVIELIGNETVGNLSGEGLCFFNGPCHAQCTGSQNHLGSICTHQQSALHAHGIRHDNDGPIASGRSNCSKTNSGISGGGLYDSATGGMLVVTVLAAFGFARLNFRGKDLVFTLFLALMMIPGELVVITNYVTITEWELRNSFMGLILPSVTSVFYIYLLKENFAQIPDELYYAAKVDGTSDFRYLWKVLIPICRPTIITITILKVIECWNSYVWPRLITDDPNYYLVSNGIQFIRENGFGRENIPAMMAAVVVISMPLIVLFLIFRKKIMAGVARGGTKG